MIKKHLLQLIVIAAFLAVILAFSGCGKKGDPIPSKVPSPEALSGCRVVVLNHR